MRGSLTLLMVFFAASILCEPAYADQPPPWHAFEIKSANGRYAAYVTSTDESGDLQPWQRSYRLTVSEIADAQKSELWSCDYDYDGYPGGYLSDDGSTFAYISFWYFDTSPVVSIYRNGLKSGAFMGKDFNIQGSKLLDTVSHRLWLIEEGVCCRFTQTESAALALEISTIDGNTHIIDIETATISDQER